MKEVSCGLVLEGDKILLQFDSENQVWDIPHDTGKRGELGADTAERVASEVAGCDARVLKYKKKLKTEFDDEGEHYKYQPYVVELEDEPKEGEFVSPEELEPDNVSKSLQEMKGKLASL
ncbi:MAG: hypothetical protein ABEJ99_04160 [Candidatus Nanohaloarchaea archaeon]